MYVYIAIAHQCRFCNQELKLQACYNCLQSLSYYPVSAPGLVDTLKDNEYTKTKSAKYDNTWCNLRRGKHNKPYPENAPPTDHAVLICMFLSVPMQSRLFLCSLLAANTGIVAKK